MIKQFLRVKQIADQKFQRNEKSSVLSHELNAAEKRVDLIKESCYATGKKLSACMQRLMPDASDKKNTKKVPEASFAKCMEEWGLSLGESSILGMTLVDYARVQEALASDLLSYKLQVEENVVEPLQNILNVDVSNIMKHRKQLTKLSSEMDAAKNRYVTAQRNSLQATGNGANAAATKAQLLKEETEDVISRLDQCRDSLTAEMFNLISREPEMSNLFVRLCQLQLEYHRKAFYMLESALPEIESQINCCPYQPVFGIPLENHLKISKREIATVIETCVCCLLESAIEEEGLFRIGGSMIKIKKMKSAFDAGFHHLIEEEKDPHNVAGVLKLYLRSLPNPLLTYELYDHWMEAALDPDHDSRLRALWSIVNSLPKAHFTNLKYLIKFLAKLCQNSEMNKMSIQNVAIVIGPNLLWSPIEDSTLGLNMTATNIHSSIVDTLITYADWFFPGDCEFYVSTPTSPRHLNGFGSQLSLTTAKLSNGDSAVDSMSSSPTNSSPKSPSPRVPLRPRKKAAPKAPESVKNQITRSVSCTGFQANVLAKANALHNAHMSAALSISHENLLNAGYVSSQEERQQEINRANMLQSSVILRPHECHPTRPKPLRLSKKGLPPVAERSHRSIVERPSVPPPERPDSFYRSDAISPSNVASEISPKVVDLEDISVSFDSSSSESYNECQMSFADDSDNDFSRCDSLDSDSPRDLVQNQDHVEENKPGKETIQNPCNRDPSIVPNDFHFDKNGDGGEFENTSSLEMDKAVERKSQFSVVSSRNKNEVVSSTSIFHYEDSSNNKVGIWDDRSSENLSPTEDNIFHNDYNSTDQPLTWIEKNEAFPERPTLEDINGSFEPNHHHAEDTPIWVRQESSPVSPSDQNVDSSCHFTGGTPTWFDHYGEDKRQSNTLWFSNGGCQDDSHHFRHEKLSSIQEDVPSPTDSFRTIIEVGSGLKHCQQGNSVIKNTVSGFAIKLRVNSESHDTRL